ncbi:putative monovalent cation/H+ antiporter subunit D [Brevibacterium mcbrellneri ATCC 49030]|uniref:Putative monovalent cation/H+ antiporter subunit D n=1 Tax=Brevibacterium mcbrellneri ATCC 49030 TaxID=585530 RepID=D4YL64_9MICO|nr:Na+/H+ antiporter subunit D [Brevibacterium mcbrellneri]EFG48158.1 putative monovalent cation/H+ antiporter subunit D [Brevibacterium mcbrellneri ATCC 49030]
MTALVPLPVVLPLLGAGLTLLLLGKTRIQNFVTVLTIVITLCFEVAMVFYVDAHGTQVVAVGGWGIPFGISLVVDRLSAVMVVVSSIVTLCVLVYAISQEMADTNRESPVSVFNPAYLILCAGVSNAFMAGDLFNFYVGFEMLLAASYVLLTLGATPGRIRAGATYIVVSLLSSIVFLAAIGLIYGATGTVNMAQLSQRIAELPSDVQLFLHVTLLIGFGIKAAVFPLSFWLPDSYPTAPAPVTAVFAGLLTKVGIYAIIRTETLLFHESSMQVPLLVVSALTLIVGILGAVAQTEMKRMLSFTLISHIGYLLFGVAMGTVDSLSATVYYTVHHIIVQTALFLAVGLVEQRVGTTSTRKLGGLARLAPFMALLFFIPALNLGGIPPFSGFLGKIGLFTPAIAGGNWLEITVVIAGTLTSLLTLYVVTRTWSLAFWNDPADVESPTPELVTEFQRATSAIQKNERRPRGPRLPAMMVGATAAIVTVSCLLTLAAGPLWDFSQRAGENMRDPDNYVSTSLTTHVEER